MKIKVKCNRGEAEHYFEADKIRVVSFDKECPEYQDYWINYVEKRKGFFDFLPDKIEVEVENGNAGNALWRSRPTGRMERIRITEKFATCPICEKEVKLSRIVETIKEEHER